MTSLSTPMVSIGVPVHNGEATLAAALGSIAAQTFEDLEVIVCDNDSSDGTAEICREWAERDPRFRYFKNQRNLGAAANFNRTFSLSRGKFFKWHAADDVLVREYLEACILPLQKDASVVLCYPTRTHISHDGRPVTGEPYLIRYRQLPEGNLNDLTVANLLRICPSRMPLLVFGLIRSSVLAKTALIGAFPSSDVSLVFELRLHGKFAQIPRPLYAQRLHTPDASVRSRMTRRGDASWFGANGGIALYFPELNLFFEMLRAQRRAAVQRGSDPSRREHFKTARELLALSAHLEIRAVRSLSINYRKVRRSLFNAWSQLSESFLVPDAPNLWALRVWRGGAAAAKGRFDQVRALVLPRGSAQLLADSLARLLERGSEESLSLLTDWLASEDPEKAHLAVRAYTGGTPDKKVRFLAHLDARGAHEARARLEAIEARMP